MSKIRYRQTYRKCTIKTGKESNRHTDGLGDIQKDIQRDGQTNRRAAEIDGQKVIQNS